MSRPKPPYRVVVGDFEPIYRHTIEGAKTILGRYQRVGYTYPVRIDQRPLTEDGRTVTGGWTTIVEWRPDTSRLLR